MFIWYVYTCTCVVDHCSQPPDIANGNHGTPTGFSSGEWVTYSCNSGYTLVGSSFSTCQENGEWSTPPTCSIISL